MTKKQDSIQQASQFEKAPNIISRNWIYNN